MSVVGPPDVVYESNRKLFARYMSIFRSRSSQEFVQYATRFARWLGDSKAYYPEARQEIITLLLTAQANLRRTLGLHDQFSTHFHVDQFPNNEMVAAYAAMVRAVEPFSAFFVEPSLSAHLLKLRETVAHDASSLPVTSMPSSYAVPPNPQPLPTQPNAPLENGRNIQQYTTTPIVSNRQSSMPSTPSTSTSNSTAIATNLTQIKHPLSPRPTGTSPPQPLHSTLPNSTIPQKLQQSVATTSLQKKIVKKRKTLDIEELYTQDIQSFLQKKKANQPTTPLFLPSDASSATSTPEPVQRASWSPQVVAQSTDRDTSRPIPVTTGVQQSAINANTLVAPSRDIDHSSLGHAEQSLPDMVVDGRHERRKDDERTILDSGHIQTEAPVPSFPSQQRPTDNDDSKTQTDAMEVDFQSQISPPLEQTQLGCMMPTEHTPHLDSMHVDQRDPHLGQPQTDKCDAIANIPTHIVPSATCPHIDRVLARRLGDHPECNTPFEFVVPQDIYDCVSRWKDCINPSTDLAATACITLKCFPSSAADGALVDNELSAKLHARSSSWPDTGNLCLLLGANGITETIPLSPPLEITPDNSVDLSEFVLSGVNTAQILSTKKLPNVIFVVHVHSPTAKQQERVVERRQKEQDWQNFLTNLTRPFIHPSS